MPAYALTIFTGAFLLFQVQPLIGKYILPWFGGGPGVWTTCLLFFQVLLLGGYAYAHITSRRLKPRAQVILHLALLVGALALLPIVPADSWKPRGGGNPTLQILVLLTANLGLPYFVLSSTGPLMQHWFSRTKPGVSPYRLYALSNAGSLLALLSFPFCFETHFTRRTQAVLWAWGLGLYAVFCAWCALKLWKTAGAEEPQERAEAGAVREPAPALDAQRSAESLLVADPVAPADAPGAQVAECAAGPLAPALSPLISDQETIPRTSNDCWNPEPTPDGRAGCPHPAAASPHAGESAVGTPRPTTNSINSETNPSWPQRLLWLLLPACASVLLLATTNKMCQDVAVIPFLWVVPLGLYLLSFIVCFDSPRWYVRFPYALALAAALGGLCWALNHGTELGIYKQVGIYSGGLFVCCLVCHGELYRLRPHPSQLTAFYLLIAAGGALGGLFVAVAAPLLFTDYYELHWGLWLCGLLFLAACVRDWQPIRYHPWRLLASGGLALGVAALGVVLWSQARKARSEGVYRSRNFYGVLAVLEYSKNDPKGHYFLLEHGRITHGLEFVDPLQATWPTTYYGEESGVGLAVRALPTSSRRIGVVGLGTGTLAAYGRAGDYLRIYEIDPAVQRLATTRFHYLRNCPGTVEIAPGDARLSLEREPPQHFDLLALDAFSSDAIPVHLLTREAFAVYERHLQTNGILAVHISNHYLDLAPVVANLARQFHYKLAAIDYDESAIDWWLYSSTWMLLTRSEQIINSPAITAAATDLKLNPAKIPLWTDDFASLFQILK